MRKTRHQIHWQLTAYAGAVICVLTGLFLVIDKTHQWRNLVDARSAYMQQEVQLLALALEHEPSSSARADFLTNYCAMMRYHGKPGHALTVLDSSGLFHTTGKQLTKDELTQSTIVEEARNAPNAMVGHVYEEDGGKVLAVAREFTSNSNAGKGIVLYSEPLNDLEALARKLFIQRAAIAVGLLFAVITVIWVFVKQKVAAPLSALLAHEYAASKGDLHPKRFADPHNEITDVQIMFNHMLKKLEQRELTIQGVHDTADPRQLVSRLKDRSAEVVEIHRLLNRRRDTLPRGAQEILDLLHDEARSFHELIAALHRELGGPDEGPTLFSLPS